MTIQELSIWVTTLCVVSIMITLSLIGIFGYRKWVKDSELLQDIQMGISVAQIIAGVVLCGLSGWLYLLQQN